MGIFYRENAFDAGEKIRKNDFAPSEKYSSYAPGHWPNQKQIHVKFVELHSTKKYKIIINVLVV